MQTRIIPIALVCLLRCATAQFQPDQGRAVGPVLPPLQPLPTPITAMAIGDLDGNGQPDVLAVESTRLQPILRTSTGWLRAATTTSVPNRQLRLLDLDADLDLDVLALPGDGSSPAPLLVFHNPGNGIPLPVTLPAGLATLTVQGATAGDVDGDGDADLIVAPAPGATTPPPLQLYRNTGNRTFVLDGPAIPTNLPFNCWPELLDFDRDGDLDLAASSLAGGYILLRNGGTGVFTDARSSLPSMRLGHTYTVAGDFDGDTRPDLAMTWFNGDVDVLWNGAAGFVFQAAVSTGTTPRRLLAGNFDGDGDDDLFVFDATICTVLEARGNRQVRSIPTFPGASLTGSGVGDLDGNGMADLLGAFTSGIATRALLGTANGLLEDAAANRGFQQTAGTPRQHPIVGDVDGDGRPDVLQPLHNGLAAQLANGDGTWRLRISPQPAAVAGTVQRGALADFDRDGDLDLLVASPASAVLYRNDGTGGFATWITFAGASVIGNVTLGDVDGDQDVDLVRMLATGPTLHRNLGNGTFASPVLLRAAENHCCAVLADLDGDQDLDLVTDIATATGALLLRNDGTGAFAPHPGFTADFGGYPLAVAAGDADGDGDQDLVVGGFAGQGLRLLTNSGSGAFTLTAGAFAAMNGIDGESLVFADLDDDGDRDVAALIAAGNSAVRVFDNDGTGTFTDVTATRWLMAAAVSTTTYDALVAGDADGDGDLELLRGGPQDLDQTIAWNHTRQLASRAAPRVGGATGIDVWSGSGFGPPGIVVTMVSLGGRPTPLHLAGIAGNYELESTTLTTLAVVATPATGATTTTLAIPPVPTLAGLPLVFQGVVADQVGRAAFSNAVREVVLP